MIAQVAAEGNLLAREVLDGACRAYGWAVAQMITLLAPNVVVIGGGDTGSDCVGTSIRQGATAVRQIEIVERNGELIADGTRRDHYSVSYRIRAPHGIELALEAPVRVPAARR